MPKPKKREWPIAIAICEGCGEVVPNDDLCIQDGRHHIRYFNSDGECAVDNVCGEVAVYRFSRPLSKKSKVKTPAKDALAPIGHPFNKI